MNARPALWNPDDRFATPAQERYEYAATLAVKAMDPEYRFTPAERSQLTTAVEAALADIEDARERARELL